MGGSKHHRILSTVSTRQLFAVAVVLNKSLATPMWCPERFFLENVIRILSAMDRTPKGRLLLPVIWSTSSREKQEAYTVLKVEDTIRILTKYYQI